METPKDSGSSHLQGRQTKEERETLRHVSLFQDIQGSDGRIKGEAQSKEKRARIS